MKLYKHIATAVVVAQQPEGALLPHAADVWRECLRRIERELLPSGSGFDSGTKIDLARSDRNRLVFTTSFHHMDDAGYYDGWTDHEVVVTPDLSLEFNVRVTGKDRRQIKSYISEVFCTLLSEEAPESVLYHKVMETL